MVLGEAGSDPSPDASKLGLQQPDLEEGSKHPSRRGGDGELLLAEWPSPNWVEGTADLLSPPPGREPSRKSFGEWDFHPCGQDRAGAENRAAGAEVLAPVPLPCELV